MNRITAYITQSLLPIYDEREIKTLVAIICKDLLHVSEVDFYLRKDIELSPDRQKILEESVGRLVNHEPIQYILGEAAFYGLTFKVAPHVLIPRPETEELVDMVVRRFKQAESCTRILDIGTGSGCIAISLAHALPGVKVEAWDVSVRALDIAKENANRLQADVRFILHDVFSAPPKQEQFDVIVSNPPYIAERERMEMEQNVLEWEPDTALFVPDNDPLRFYRRIAELGKGILSPQGQIFVEINRAYGLQTMELFAGMGYKETACFKDLYGNDRIVVASL